MQLSTYKSKIVLMIIFSLIISTEVYSGKFKLFKKILIEAANEQFDKVKVHGKNIKLSESSTDFLAEKGTGILKTDLKLDNKAEISKKVATSKQLNKTIIDNKKTKLSESATDFVAGKETSVLKADLRLDNKPNPREKSIASNHKPFVKPASVAVTIRPSVIDANIKILNIKPKYKDNIKLVPGRYEFLVTKPGYNSQRFWLTLKSSNNKLHYDVNLNKIRKSLTISSSVKDVKIKILNINKKYKDNINLNPGSYQISVEKAGYRSQRFWIEINKESKSYIHYDVELHKRGITPAYCEANMTTYSYGTAFSSEGQLVQLQLLIENASVPEIYLSLAEMQTDFTNFQRVIDSKLSEDYAYYKLIQASAVSEQQIKSNASIEIDPDRNIQHTWALEKQGNSVLFILQAKIPGGVFITSNFKGFICNEFKDL